MKIHNVTLPLVATLLAPSAAAMADIIDVPADHPTIQAAIDAAADSDEIVIAPGTYAPFTVAGTLTIRSSDGPDVTTVDGGGNSTIVLLNGATDLTFQGLTFTNGSPAMKPSSSFFPHQITIDDCVFSNNAAPDGGAMSFFTNGSSNLSISNSSFNGNSASDDGGAIWISGFTFDVAMTDCTFTKNSATTVGGAIWFNMNNNADRIILGCTFDGNVASRGGAIYAQNGSGNPIENCQFINNSATSAEGGGAVYMPVPITMINCQFTSNTAPAGLGGGVRAPSGTFTNCTFDQNEAITGGGLSIDGGDVIGCDFTGNVAVQNGGALMISDATAAHCTFTGNSAGGSGAAIHAEAGESTILNCTMSDNDAGVSGGGLYVPSLVIVNISESTLCMNTPDQFAYDGALLTTNVFGCEVTCPETDPTGACCLPNGDCIPLTETTCLAVGGTYMGDGVECSAAKCPTTCVGDLDGDGVVDVQDLAMLLAAWGSCL